MSSDSRVVTVEIYCDHPGCLEYALVDIREDEWEWMLPDAWVRFQICARPDASPVDFDLCPKHAKHLVQSWMLEEPAESGEDGGEMGESGEEESSDFGVPDALPFYPKGGGSSGGFEDPSAMAAAPHAEGDLQV